MCLPDSVSRPRSTPAHVAHVIGDKKRALAIDRHADRSAIGFALSADEATNCRGLRHGAGCCDAGIDAPSLSASQGSVLLAEPSHCCVQVAKLEVGPHRVHHEDVGID